MSLPSKDFLLTGAQIKELRQKLRLTQQEFGERLGVTHAHISKIESGKENPSETLLRLIRYEFSVSADYKTGFPPAEVTRPKIMRYLNILGDMFTDNEMSDGCLFTSEYLISAYITILREASESDMYLRLLLESLGGIMDEVALFLERSNRPAKDNDSKMLLSSSLQSVKREIAACCDELYNLLDERIK